MFNVMRVCLTALSAAVLLGCSETTSPIADRDEALLPPSDPLQSIFTAAWNDVTPAARSNFTVGVLEENRSAKVAHVIFLSPRRSAETYAYVRENGRWHRTVRVDDRRSEHDGTALGDVIAASPGYPDKIAVLFRWWDPPIEWFHSYADKTGIYQKLYIATSENDEVTDAEFFPGSRTVGDTTFSVSLEAWKYWAQGGSYTGSCTTNFCETSFDTWNGYENADSVVLEYRFSRVAPVTVTISGPSELGWREPATWTASASGGDGESYSYSWQKNGFNVNKGGNRYQMTPENGETFTLRAVASSGGVSATSNEISVQARNPLYDLVNVGEISGPVILTSPGDYSWTSSQATGGDGSYTYEWYRRDPDQWGAYTTWYPVNTGRTLTLNISSCDPNFELKVRAISSTPDFGFRFDESPTIFVENYASGGDC